MEGRSASQIPSTRRFIWGGKPYRGAPPPFTVSSTEKLSPHWSHGSDRGSLRKRVPDARGGRVP
eukprot:1180769-Prorocentrum_minimum.AAC.3